jgi:hypothetical protein
MMGRSSEAKRFEKNAMSNSEQADKQNASGGRTPAEKAMKQTSKTQAAVEGHPAPKSDNKTPPSPTVKDDTSPSD